jgi:parallel beta-helix repeat protein
VSRKYRTEKNLHSTRVFQFVFILGICVCIGLIYFVQSVLAAKSTYYVSGQGNDSNSGTQSLPFKSFAKAISVLHPGDTLVILGGSYTEKLLVNVSGTVAEPITIQAAPGQRVTIDSQNVRAAPVEVPLNSSHIHLRDLEVTGSTFECVLVRGQHIAIHSFNVHSCQKFGYRLTGQNITIEHSTCHDSVTENRGGGNTSGGWGSCIKSGPGSANLILRNNRVYNNWGEGIIVGQAAGAKVYGNTVHDNYSQNIYIGNAYDVDVFGNMTYATNPVYFRGGAAANCISASEENISGWGARLKNVRVFNNIAMGCKVGVGYTYKEVTGNGCDTCLFANNTLVNTGGIRIIDGPKNHVRIINNILHGGSIQVPAGDILQSNNFSGDPKFVAAPNTTPVSYRLRSDSPAINAGISVAGITDDFEGKPRPQGGGFDQGAFESGTSAAPANPTPTHVSQSLVGDFHPDGRITIIDFTLFMSNWFTGNLRSDLNGDGRISAIDYTMFMNAWFSSR